MYKGEGYVYLYTAVKIYAKPVRRPFLIIIFCLFIAIFGLSK